MDVPDATTIVVEHADRFGLAQVDRCENVVWMVWMRMMWMVCMDSFVTLWPYISNQLNRILQFSLFNLHTARSETCKLTD